MRKSHAIGCMRLRDVREIEVSRTEEMEQNASQTQLSIRQPAASLPMCIATSSLLAKRFLQKNPEDCSSLFL